MFADLLNFDNLRRNILEFVALIEIISQQMAKQYCAKILFLYHYSEGISSIGATLGSMTSRRQIQDGGPHDVRSKMAAPTTSGPRWRPQRHQDGGPHEVRYEMAAPVTRSVTPRRVSQRPRPREGSVTS